jgi:hypothetical protein
MCSSDAKQQVLNVYITSVGRGTRFRVNISGAHASCAPPYTSKLAVLVLTTSHGVPQVAHFHSQCEWISYHPPVYD